MYYRYPRLPRAAADTKVKELHDSEDSVHAFSDGESSPVETGVVVPEAQLADIRNQLEKATDSFPRELRSAEVANWDAVVGRTLYDGMAISPADASHVDTWSFMTLVVLPDYAKWRYPNIPKNRLIGTHRNVFRRVWWRRHILGEMEIPNGCKPLGEDELVNIFERSRMARDQRLARFLASEIIGYKGKGRSAFARKLALKVRALTGSMLLDICPDEYLQEVIARVAADINKNEAESGSRPLAEPIEQHELMTPKTEKRFGIGRLFSAVGGSRKRGVKRNTQD